MESDIEQKIEEWHISDDPRPLHEYLGMTWEQYKKLLTLGVRLQEVLDQDPKTYVRRGRLERHDD